MKKSLVLGIFTMIALLLVVSVHAAGTPVKPEDRKFNISWASEGFNKNNSCVFYESKYTNGTVFHTTYGYLAKSWNGTKCFPYTNRGGNKVTKKVSISGATNTDNNSTTPPYIPPVNNTPPTNDTQEPPVIVIPPGNNTNITQPPVNNTPNNPPNNDEDDGDNTPLPKNPIIVNVDLSVKTPYPKGHEFVFVCDNDIVNARYNWVYDDGQKQYSIRNGNTFHRFPKRHSDWNYRVVCTAYNSTHLGTDALTVLVKANSVYIS